MTEVWEVALGLAGLMVGLFMWLRLDTRAALRDVRGEVRDVRGEVRDVRGEVRDTRTELSSRMDKLEAATRDVGERVARLEGKFGLVEAYILHRNDRPEAVPAE